MLWRNMVKHIALHLDNGCQRHRNLARSLKSLGIELHKASSIRTAKEMLEKHTYSLFLIQFETVNKQIFEVCSFIRSLLVKRFPYSLSRKTAGRHARPSLGRLSSDFPSYRTFSFGSSSVLLFHRPIRRYSLKRP